MRHPSQEKLARSSGSAPDTAAVLRVPPPNACLPDAGYHRDELAVAQDPSHPAHILPPPLPAGSRVLDVGCGAGQTLIAAYPQQFCVGIDIDNRALALGRQWSRHIQFAQAKAEALPFRDNEFDCIVARVSLAYTDLARSLPEIARVLKPGGLFWAVLHPAAIPLATARAGGVKARVFFTYIACNSLFFHLFGRNFRLGRRCESFQTSSGMRRALHRHGFTEVQISRGRHFVVQAKRANRNLKSGNE